jgi:hypothetical protein
VFGAIRQRFIQIIDFINISEVLSLSRIKVRILDEVVSISELGARVLGSVKVIVENVRIVESHILNRLKAYIKKLKSFMLGMSRGGEV